ncbi:hypothetical protein NDU88_006326 [Pleurodeles waltl]|uniref:Uncharacterized protein n=1 Tax=Pleurodeles waltl TaxID=8319 RepID=A0AAV7WA98_PLEWA|nr:hypothetical protein NDU88_006326 [Pleurodeles waltl]
MQDHVDPHRSFFPLCLNDEEELLVFGLDCNDHLQLLADEGNADSNTDSARGVFVYENADREYCRERHTDCCVHTLAETRWQEHALASVEYLNIYTQPYTGARA